MHLNYSLTKTFLSLQTFLPERGNIIRDDIAAQIMEEKCLVCHEAGRILLERKSREGLEKLRCRYACANQARIKRLVYKR